MTSVAPGWYADPWGSGSQRWWDGVQWTEHVHPPQSVVDRGADAAGAVATAAPSALIQAPQSAQAQEQAHASTVSFAPETPARKKRHRGWLFGIIGAVTAIALIVAVSVVAVNGLLGVDRRVALPTASQPVKDRDYVMTEPLLGLSSKSEITFPADFDIKKYRGGQISAFELFLDSSLTNRAGLSIHQSSAGSTLRMRPWESNSAMRAVGTEFVKVMSDGADAFSSWGLEPEYFLMRHIDSSGKKLEVPVVTRITAEAPGIAAPEVRIETNPAIGGLSIVWTPVAGATEYVVVASSNARSDGSDYRRYGVVGTTTETKWTSTQEGGGYAEKQNAQLALFDGLSADIVGSSGWSPFADDDDDVRVVDGYRWGVIASNGSARSRIGTPNFSAEVSALPFETARRTMNEQGTTSVDNLPTSFSYTGLDGLTRSTQAYIPEGGISRVDDLDIEVTIRGVGTRLEWRDSWYERDQAFDAEAFRTAYNARAAAAAPTTGGAVLVTKSLEQAKKDGKPVATAASTSYPVYGSDEFVRFIAGHLIVGTKYIDVTKYADAPGAQSVEMALKEAIDQNPYVFGVDGYSESFASTRTTISITYGVEAAERARLQASMASTVDRVIAEVVQAGMSDRDKAVVLNDWVTANTEYDYEALGKMESGELHRDKAVLRAFEYAWGADGTFEHGKAVCAGYAKTYDALMNAAGVPTVYVTGEVASGGRHAWNKVKIDGAWYAVDTTWNDSPAGNRYLLIRDSEFTDSATRFEDPDWIRPDLIPSYATP